MKEKIKRQKIVDRDNFTYEEKQLLAAKSDERCCHCGKKVYIGYGATVEHFIPISQGGTNRDINMVMLCKDCNKEKGNFIYRPEDYLTYLKKEHLVKLQGYFDSYISSFDFINRDNLLACDRYRVFVNPIPEKIQYPVKRKNKVKDDIVKKCSIPLWVKKATMEDVDKLTEYFIKYLKKYDCLDSKEAARINIQFWITFGCIYYIERNNNIDSFITVTVTKSNGRVMLNDDVLDHYLTINAFTYYSNDYALSVGYNLLMQIPKFLFNEQGFKQIPIKYSVIKTDPLSIDVCKNGALHSEGRFIASFMILHEDEKKNLIPLIKDQGLKKFFQRFDEIKEEKLREWFTIHGDTPYEWMMQELELDKKDIVE